MVDDWGAYWQSNKMINEKDTKFIEMTLLGMLLYLFVGILKLVFFWRRQFN